MSVAGEVAAVRAPVALRLADVKSRGPLESAAFVGVIGVLLVAPFEALRPLVTLPGQSLSTVEAVLATVLLACLWAACAGRCWPVVPLTDAAPWVVLVGAVWVSALMAPAFRVNALHMASRMTLAAAVWGVTIAGNRRRSARVRTAAAILVSGGVVGALVIADFLRVPAVLSLLAVFRSGTATVGAQVRASGPFQYPTIASMYLELSFAIGLGLLSAWPRTVHRVLAACALAVMAEGIVLTFTRAGLITMAASLALVGGWRWRRQGADGVVLTIAALAVVVAAQFATSRSAEMLMLRLTTEGQGRWFSAVVEGPSSLRLDTRYPIDVPLSITNTGRATWDSTAAEPVKLAYHWIAQDSDEVIAWEGTRTLFASPVRPGETVSVVARVGGPGRPGRFRLMWDLEQEHRLWFSTEPGAVPVFVPGTVTGPATAKAVPSGRRLPHAEPRPGRLTLWRAAVAMWRESPLLGKGMDNYRLLYGRYAGLDRADARVHSNNMYLEVLAGAGIAGIGALAWIVGATLRSLAGVMQHEDLGSGLAASCIAWGVHGMADSFLSFTGTYVLAAVTLGLASACYRDKVHRAHRV